MKKLFCLFILVFTICFVYEKRLALAEDADSPSPCLTILPEVEGEDTNRNINRAPKASVAVRDALWNHEDTVAQETNATFILRVHFLGGTEDEKSFVRQVAQEWSQYANIRFEFVEHGASDIRIGFDKNGGNWSEVGKRAIGKAKTMNIEDKTERVVLHEFGHALGLIHEHQSPVAPIEWNEAVVIKEMKEEGWNEQEIRYNILNQREKKKTNFSEFDPHSIMVYWIPNRWTKGDFQTNYNTSLSAMDQYFIAALYGIIFPDLNLRAKIEDVLNLGPNAPITPDGLEQLTEFRAKGNQIRDLTGLEDATQLTTLSLDGNEIVDVSPLSNLTQLTTLWLDGNEIVDVSPLSNLTQLTTLWLNDNSIEDITPLVGLVNLEELTLAENPIQGVSSFCQLLARNPDLGVDITPQNCVYWVTFDHVTDTEILKSADLDGGNRSELHTVRNASLSDFVVDGMGGKIYWAAYNRETETAKLESADLDGGNRSELRTVRDASLHDLAVDGMSGKIYWIAFDNTGPDRIQCVDSDGGNRQTLLTSQDFSLDSLIVDGVSGKIYWIANNAETKIGLLESADLDGGNRRTLHKGERVSLHNLVVDGVNGKIYWIANNDVPNTEILKSADLDGGNRSELRTVRDASLHDLVVDGMNGKIYWIAFDKGTRMERLESADLDGQNRQTLHTVSDTSLSDLVVDGMGGKIYWIADNRETEIAKLESADLDGGNRQTLVSSPNSISTFAVATSPTDMPPGNVEVNEPLGNVDVNTDGVVNILDLVAVAASFGQTGENIADVNTDGVVNILDLVAVAAALGNTAAAPDILYLNTETVLTKAEVTQWLQQARQLDLTDPTFQYGIRFLEHLLAVLTPKETALLPNYPNPFNPETWIPYQLAEAAAVTLTISDIQGRVVRILALGHQRAGIYEDRVRAAYWDGRNALGEPVASGVYFYTLKAGEFTVTRKMLIRK